MYTPPQNPPLLTLYCLFMGAPVICLNLYESKSQTPSVVEIKDTLLLGIDSDYSPTSVFGQPTDTFTLPEL